MNTYRCLFDVDTQVVPGGCEGGQPAQGPTEPAAFEGVASQDDLDVRDRLVADQEALLNTYRCLFDVDTQIVPGGCGGHSCGIRSDDTVVCWGRNGSGETDAPAGSFKTVSAGSNHSCGIRSNDTIVCWGDIEATLGSPTRG